MNNITFTVIGAGLILILYTPLTISFARIMWAEFTNVGFSYNLFTLILLNSITLVLVTAIYVIIMALMGELLGVVPCIGNRV